MKNGLDTWFWMWGIAAVIAIGAAALLALLRHVSGRMFVPRMPKLMCVMAVLNIAVIVLCCVLLALSPIIHAPSTTDTSPENDLQSLASLTVAPLAMPEHSQEHFYSRGDFQDYTEYGVYLYPHLTDEQLQDSKLRPVAADDIALIAAYLDDFSRWVKVYSGSSLARHFDFDAACLNAGDWFLLEDKADTDSAYHPFNDYCLWLYDRETDTLYYFHNDF